VFVATKFELAATAMNYCIFSVCLEQTEIFYPNVASQSK